MQITEDTAEGLDHEKNSLELNSDTSMRVYYKLGSGHKISEYAFSIDGTATTVRGSASTGYGVMISNIPSALLDTEHTFKAAEKAGDGELTVKASALSYLYTILTDSESSQELQNVAKALYNYNHAANVYFGK